MAGDWIKVQTCTPDKPEVHQLAEMLELEPDAIVGKLIRIWAWADMHTVDGNAASVTRSLLDRITNVSGFADALSKVGWLESMPAGVHFTNFDRHNGETAKTRALTSKRVAKNRSKACSVTEVKRECNGESVTESLPEKRREEVLYIPGEDVRIPEKVNTPQVRKSLEMWLEYLRKKDTETGSRKAIEHNSIEEQSLWLMISGWNATPEEIQSAVTTAISSKWDNLRKPESPRSNGRQKQSADWIKALNAARQYPMDWEKRKQVLGTELFEALKITGTARVVAANDFELKTLQPLFEQNLKEIRNAVTVSS